MDIHRPTGRWLRSDDGIRACALCHGKVSASLVQIDPGGGATVAFSNYVYLNEVGRDRSNSANFEGYSCGPVSLELVLKRVTARQPES